jgi:hypothetical protein
LKLRLDSIARLIEGYSLCAAIGIFKQYFLIATNEAFPSGLDTKSHSYEQIDKVMSYLKLVLERKNTDEKTRSVF